MEKLTELLNEWSKTAIENKCNWTDVYDKDGLYFMNLSDRDMTMEVEEVISKTFGFIKWLVENDKIDFSLIPNKIKEIGIPMKINGEIKYGFDSSDYYWLLMLLAIQDEPIRFLCEILK